MPAEAKVVGQPSRLPHVSAGVPPAASDATAGGTPVETSQAGRLRH